MTIRRATHPDTDRVLALWSRSRGEAPSTPDDEASVARAIDEGALLVLELPGGEIAGTLIAAADGWRGNMYRLVVAPEHRGRGMARALVTAGEDRLRERGVRRITALVAREDTVAVTLWSDAGYAEDVGTARYVRNI